MASDGQLIARSRQDPEVFRVVFDRHFTLVYRYLAGRVGPAAAEDLAAECFLRAFDRRDRYRSAHSDARPWLLSIATNLLRERRRGEERWLRALARAGGEPAGDGGLPDVAARLDARASVPLLATALAGLRPAERDVLLLVALGELAPAEVAAILGIPAGTVRARLSRARAQLRRALTAPEAERAAPAQWAAEDLGEVGGRA